MTAIEKSEESTGGIFSGALARRRAKRTELKALIEADKKVAPDSYYFGTVDMTLYALPIFAPIMLTVAQIVDITNPFSTLLGIPMAGGVVAFLNRSKFVYLSRRKKGLVGVEDKPADLGELRAETVRKEPS